MALACTTDNGFRHCTSSPGACRKPGEEPNAKGVTTGGESRVEPEAARDGGDAASDKDGGLSGIGARDGGDSPSARSDGGDAASREGCSRATLGDPAVDPCAIDEAIGVFVSPGATEEGDGTRARPFLSLEQALAATRGDRKRIYVCATAGDYTATVTLNAADSNREIYGSFDCASWAYNPDVKARFVASGRGTWVLDNVSDLYVRGVEIVALPARSMGHSSIGVLIATARKVHFDTCRLTAGAGAQGEEGQSGADGNSAPEAAEDQHGRDGFCLTDSVVAASQPGGHWPTVSACGNRGGEGGAARRDQEGSSGLTGTPPTPAQLLNNGSAATLAAGGDGTIGTLGLPGTPGGVGPVSGILAPSEGYVPALAGAGSPGSRGGPGGGGGGGRSISAGNIQCLAGSGGAGGPGGCGGLGGQGGRGGGASFALALLNSTVTLTGCELSSAAGGQGGQGGAGGFGGRGGAGARGGSAARLQAEDPATALTMSGGGKGGDGALGGSGGPGAGGSGGPSAAIAHVGSPPELEDTMLSAGPGGEGGQGGITLIPSEVTCSDATCANVCGPEGSIGGSAIEGPGAAPDASAPPDCNQATPSDTTLRIVAPQGEPGPSRTVLQLG